MQTGSDGLGDKKASNLKLTPLFTSMFPHCNLLASFLPPLNLCFVGNLQPRFGNHVLHNHGKCPSGGGWYVEEGAIWNSCCRGVCNIYTSNSRWTSEGNGFENFSEFLDHPLLPVAGLTRKSRHACVFQNALRPASASRVSVYKHSWRAFLKT